VILFGCFNVPSLETVALVLLLLFAQFNISEKLLKRCNQIIER